MGNPNRSQKIMPDKGLFLEAEKNSVLYAYLWPFHHALNIPTLWPEIDRTKVESLARGQMDQPWPSMVSESAFLSEVVQKGPLVSTRFPHSLSTKPIHPRQPSSTKECVPCAARSSIRPQLG